MMRLGADGVFVGSGIFKSSHPEKLGQAIVQAVTYYQHPDRLADVASHVGDAMPGIDMQSIVPEALLSERGN